MIRQISTILKTTLLLVITCCQTHAANENRIRKSFNENWKFLKGGEHLEVSTIDDSTWREVNLPHDWAIEGPFDKKYNARTGGLPVWGTGWYRKHFETPQNDKEKKVFIEFDGAMSNSEVWINGHFLGNRPFGYIGFEYELTPYLKAEGSQNTLTVKLSPEDKSSRWYSGAGLYRNTWLTTKPKIHIEHWGTKITTPNITETSALVKVEASIINTKDVDVNVRIRTAIEDPDGVVVKKQISDVYLKANSKTSEVHVYKLKDYQQWDLYSPRKYKVYTKIINDNKVMDTYKSYFGIRDIQFSAKDGVSLNGKKLRLNGVCLHHDLGPLGAAVNRRAMERKLKIMKKMGANAIRTSHNPPAPELLDLCDEMGLLVIVEAFDCWAIAKRGAENGYNKYFDEWHERDLRDIIRCDFNHPSVILWSIGNEIMEQGNKKTGALWAKTLTNICHDEDPSRLVTAGFNNYAGAVNNGLADAIDIVGLNYKPTLYKETLEKNPDWIIYGSETSSCTSSRGIYHLPVEKYEKDNSLQVTSYDIIGPSWAYPPDIEFHYLNESPRILGEFIWTGFDYLGEPTPYGGLDHQPGAVWKGDYWNHDWPARSSYFGAVDLCGFPKDRYYLYQSEWTTEPMVHLLPHWNWEGKEGDIIPVYAYTNTDEVELFLNGKSLGRKRKGKDLSRIIVRFSRYENDHFDSPYRLDWQVPYTKGTLKAVAYKNDKAVASKIIHTAESAANIRLKADRTKIKANGKDLSFVTVEITDSNGHLCPKNESLMHFNISGPGQIIAVGNGNAATTAPFQANQRKAFNGKALVVIKSLPNQIGEIQLTAKSKGLTQATTKISSQ